MGTLPAPREVLTSLINGITSTPAGFPPQTQQGDTTSERSNPLKDLPASQRPLLATLHVLYPSLLLPALDLLDRNLVTRVRLAARPAGNPGIGARIDERHRRGDEGEDGTEDARGATAFYLVRSAASSSRRGYSAAPPPSQPYIVHLSAWHCSCASFAFAALLPTTAEPAGEYNPGREEEDGATTTHDAEEWKFGGLSLEGGGPRDSVPCCKHLLACLLAERWAALGKYVVESSVGREEMAAMVYEL